MTHRKNTERIDDLRGATKKIAAATQLVRDAATALVYVPASLARSLFAGLRNSFI
jgi:hypothetical protein